MRNVIFLMIYFFAFNLINAQSPADLALVEAAKDGRTERVKSLLIKGANPNTSNEEANPLLYAVWQNNPEMVQLFLQYGANVNAAYKGKTALTEAALIGRFEIVQQLIDNNANPELLSTEYGTPLMCAIRTNKSDIFQYLLQKGANVNTQIKGLGNALTEACIRGRLAMAQQLIAEGVQVDAHAEEVASPLIEAAKRGHLEIVKLLIANGADVNQTIELHDNIIRTGKRKLVLDGYQSVQKTTMTPLKAARINHRKQVITYLLDQGAVQ